MSTSLTQILNYCDSLLQPQRFSDYCPNGLQVEGGQEVSRVITGVSATQPLIERAIAANAEMIVVHHGYFWKGDDPRVRGMLKARLKLLLEHNISLVAYHLPLDAQPEFGNNASLARVLGFQITGGLQPEAEHSIGLVGALAEAQTSESLSNLISRRLARTPLHIPGGNDLIRTIAWCTGAAQGYIEQAVAANVDAYLTGEASEQTVHIAREAGIHFFAAGHHATERYGVQALGERLAQQFGIEQRFIDIDNPV